MRYRTVDRIMTVEFDRLTGTKAYEVRITPERSLSLGAETRSCG